MKCRKCGIGIEKDKIYCLECYIEFKRWLRQADHKVRTFEQAGHNDYSGYEDKPAYNGEAKIRYKRYKPL